MTDLSALVARLRNAVKHGPVETSLFIQAADALEQMDRGARLEAEVVSQLAQLVKDATKRAEQAEADATTWRLKALGASVSDEGTVSGLGAALLTAEALLRAERIETTLVRGHLKQAQGERDQAQATITRLTEALREMVALFPSPAALREITPEDAEAKRRCGLEQRSPTVADVLRWNAALNRAAPMVCPTCGPNAKIDEDGCCVTCGADCVVSSCVSVGR